MLHKFTPILTRFTASSLWYSLAVPTKALRPLIAHRLPSSSGRVMERGKPGFWNTRARAATLKPRISDIQPAAQRPRKFTRWF